MESSPSSDNSWQESPDDVITAGSSQWMSHQERYDFVKNRSYSKTPKNCSEHVFDGETYRMLAEEVAKGLAASTVSQKQESLKAIARLIGLNLSE